MGPGAAWVMFLNKVFCQDISFFCCLGVLVYNPCDSQFELWKLLFSSRVACNMGQMALAVAMAVEFSFSKDQAAVVNLFLFSLPQSHGIYSEKK